jgi:hypothetical protein
MKVKKTLAVVTLGAVIASTLG